jgi:hypothetical protein
VPALPVAPGVIKVQLLWEVGDKDAENVLHFTFSGGAPASDTFVNNVAAAMVDNVSGLIALWAPSTVFTGCKVTDLSSDTAPFFEVAASAAGTREGTILAAQVAQLVDYPINRRYRGGHPRSYLPWLTAADLDTAQTWTTGSLTDVQNNWVDNVIENLIGEEGGGNAVSAFVSLSYYTDKMLRTTPLTDTINIPGITVSPLVATIRRRDGRHISRRR